MPADRSRARLILLIVVGLVLVVATGAYLVGTPSDEYVLLPDSPHPADAIVKVAGEDPAGKPDGPGIYYLDVRVHRATIAESWLTPLQSDAERVQAVQILPPGGQPARPQPARPARRAELETARGARRASRPRAPRAGHGRRRAHRRCHPDVARTRRRTRCRHGRDVRRRHARRIARRPARAAREAQGRASR